MAAQATGYAQALGDQRHARGSGRGGRRHSFSRSVAVVTPGQIDAVFDAFDSKGNGFMDLDDTKRMIKRLLACAEAADCEKKVKYRHLLVLRAQAARARDAALASNTPSSQGTSVASSAEDSSGDDLSA